MVELAQEIRGIAGQRPVRGEEFESIKRNMLLRLPGRFETLSSLEGAAEEIVNYGYPAKCFQDYASGVRRLTEDDPNAAAGKIVDPERITWIVIGDLRRIEKGIRELDYGEPIRLDAGGRPITRSTGKR